MTDGGARVLRGKARGCGSPHDRGVPPRRCCPPGTIESPQREDVTVRLATVLRVLARTTAESFAVNRCSIFPRQGDVLVPLMSHREPRASLSATRVTRASAARRSAPFIPTVVRRSAWRRRTRSARSWPPSRSNFSSRSSFWSRCNSSRITSPRSERVTRISRRTREGRQGRAGRERAYPAQPPDRYGSDAN